MHHFLQWFVYDTLLAVRILTVNILSQMLSVKLCPAVSSLKTNAQCRLTNPPTEIWSERKRIKVISADISLNCCLIMRGITVGPISIQTTPLFLPTERCLITTRVRRILNVKVWTISSKADVHPEHLVWNMFYCQYNIVGLGKVFIY